MQYEENRSWSDKFIPLMRAVIGPHLLEPAPFDVDTKQATDLVILRARDQMIACRVRRAGYMDRYPYQFTVRAKLDSGTRTELEKLVDGFGDWMFYAHAAAGDTGFALWWLIDLHAWRAALIRNRAGVVSEQKSNGDGTHFVAFDLRSFPANPPILVGSSHPLPSARRAA